MNDRLVIIQDMYQHMVKLMEGLIRHYNDLAEQDMEYSPPFEFRLDEQEEKDRSEIHEFYNETDALLSKYKSSIFEFDFTALRSACLLLDNGYIINVPELKESIVKLKKEKKELEDYIEAQKSKFEEMIDLFITDPEDEPNAREELIDEIRDLYDI